MDRLLELTSLAEQSHFWFRGFRWYVRPEIARAVKGLERPRLLDCGCGTGSNLAMLDAFGEAFGFDLTWNGLALARARGRRVARASIEAVPFPSGHFDVVTSFDVFQCLPDDVERQAAREMLRVLKPGGHAIVHVAALEMLSGGHSVLSEEVRRYTPGRLRWMFEGAGFAVERLTFDHATLLPIMLPVRVWQRWRSRGNMSAGEFDIRVPPAPVNAALTALVRLEAAALRLGNMPIGSSLLMRARKPQGTSARAAQRRSS
jgi:SAM-dependent methyltransferase